MILCYAHCGIAYEANRANFQVFYTAEIVEYFPAIGGGIKRIDCEITARSVFLPIC
jgi:hypothetical protein